MEIWPLITAQKLSKALLRSGAVPTALDSKIHNRSHS